MIQAQEHAYALLFDAVQVTNAGTGTSQTIDTIVNGVKYNYLSIPLWGTTSNNATNIPTVLKLQESDTTDATNFSNMTAFTGGTAVSTSVGFVIPAAFATATSQQPYAVFDVNLLGHKRYIRALISPVTTQTFSAIGILSRPEQAQYTLAGRNISGVIVVG